MSWSEIPNDDSLEKLLADQYLIYFNSSLPRAKYLQLYIKPEECISCPYTPYSVYGLVDNLQTMSSKWTSDWRIQYPDGMTENNTVCTLKPDVAEFGIYHLHINKENCTLETLVEPVNIYLSILSAFFILLSIWIVLYFIYWLYNKEYLKKQRETEDDKPEKIKKRILSLDTFRGISITVMMFVNYGAGGYNFFEHAVWNGLNVADLVFPWFMWIMGVCIPISIKSALKRNEGKRSILLNIFRRSCILFVLGLALNSTYVIKELRICGVLQRFAACYFFVATLNLIFTKKDEPSIQNKMFKDIIILMGQWIVILIVLAIHTGIIFGVPFADCPKGYLGPGGLHEYGQYWNCTGGITGYIDTQFFGTDRMLKVQLNTHYGIYSSIPFDPEGLLGTLTSIVQVFIGVQTGVIIQVHKNHKSRIIRWLIWAAVTGLIGGGLCEFSRDDGIIPVNKNLWSLSYVLVTSCFAFIVLTICYVLIDVKSWWSGNPFIFAGMNAIIIYVGHSITFYRFPFNWNVAMNATHFQSLVSATWSTCFWLVVAYWLYTKKFFLSI